MSNDIKIVRGTSLDFVVTVANDDGTVYQLNSGDKLIFGVKQNPENTSYDVQKIVTSANQSGDGYLVSLEPADTANLTFGRYWYDIGLQTVDGDYYMIIECSEFIVGRAVTAKE